MDVFVDVIFPVVVSFAFYFCNWFVTYQNLIMVGGWRGKKIWSQNFSLFGPYCEICFSPTKKINFCEWSWLLKSTRHSLLINYVILGILCYFLKCDVSWADKCFYYYFLFLCSIVFASWMLNLCYLVLRYS